MARTNLARPQVHTHEGAVTQRGTSLQQLQRSVMSCMLWEREFYEDGEEIAERIVRLVGEVDSAHVLQIAIDARQKMHLRHVPLLIGVALMKHGRGTLARDVFANVIQRADELAEVFAIFAKVNGRPLDKLKPIPAALKKGVADAFHKFDEYQLAKYDRAGQVRLRDALFLCHPKPEGEEEAALWKRLVDGKLAVPQTWEVGLSAGGGAKTEEEKRIRWNTLLSERKLGAMALLRNLRNMTEANVAPVAIEAALDEARVDRVLPFRFISAARAVPSLEPAIERALFRKLEGDSKIKGNTIVLLDHSGSMSARVSGRSEISRADAAAGVAMILRERCAGVRVFAFSDWFDEVPARHGFALRDAYHDKGTWWGTHLGRAIKVCNEIGYDRVVVITDEQSHDAVGGPIDGSRAYMVNVASAKNGVGHGAWTRISGWSEAVVDYIARVEAATEGPECDE